jgi:predicted RNase H-like HicB family nuclease
LIRYAVIIGKAAGNCSACVPDLHGCVAWADTVAESEIRDAIRFHIESLQATLQFPSLKHHAMYYDVSKAVCLNRRLNSSGKI